MMVENSILLKTINELVQFSFYIPSYQRGYRWTTQEVTDLLCLKMRTCLYAYDRFHIIQKASFLKLKCFQTGAFFISVINLCC